MTTITTITDRLWHIWDRFGRARYKAWDLLPPVGRYHALRATVDELQLSQAAQYRLTGKMVTLLEELTEDYRKLADGKTSRPDLSVVRGDGA